MVNPPAYPKLKIPLVELPTAEPYPLVVDAEPTPDAVEVQEE
jgi:hypothetical protein